MPTLGSKPDQSARQRILLATGLGAIFGFQSWRLAEWGLPVSIPWYGSAWMFLSHVILGFGVGANVGSTRWCSRGLALGLFFSIPSALGAHTLGLRWVPYGVAVITSGLAAGLLIAFLTDALFPRTRTSIDRRSPVLERLRRPENSHSAAFKTDLIRQRLAEGKDCLERLDTERESRRDSGFGTTTEDRVVWSELLELELQDIDEQVSRICDAAGGARGQPPRKSMESDTYLRKRRFS